MIKKLGHSKFDVGDGFRLGGYIKWSSGFLSVWIKLGPYTHCFYWKILDKAAKDANG